MHVGETDVVQAAPPPCVGVQGVVSVGGAGSGAELLCVVGIVCRE